MFDGTVANHKVISEKTFSSYANWGPIKELASSGPYGRYRIRR
jgi:hypothetical protein